MGAVECRYAIECVCWCDTDENDDDDGDNNRYFEPCMPSLSADMR